MFNLGNLAICMPAIISGMTEYWNITKYGNVTKYGQWSADWLPNGTNPYQEDPIPPARYRAVIGHSLDDQQDERTQTILNRDEIQPTTTTNRAPHEPARPGPIWTKMQISNANLVGFWGGGSITFGTLISGNKWDTFFVLKTLIGEAPIGR